MGPKKERDTQEIVKLFIFVVTFLVKFGSLFKALFDFLWRSWKRVVGVDVKQAYLYNKLRNGKVCFTLIYQDGGESIVPYDRTVASIGYLRLFHYLVFGDSLVFETVTGDKKYLIYTSGRIVVRKIGE